MALITGVGISFTPIEARPEIVAGIIKVSLLVTFSQLQTGGRFARFAIFLVAMAVLCGGIIGALKLGLAVPFLKICGMTIGWVAGIGLVAWLIFILDRFPYWGYPITMG